MAVGNVTIPIDHLRAGATCRHPIEDGSGLLLLGQSTRITQQVISGLRERGIHAIDVHPSDLQALTGKAKPATLKTQRERSGAWQPSVPLKDLLIDRHDEGLSDDRAERLKSGMAAAQTQFDSVQQSLAGGELRTVEAMSGISNAFARALVDDHDQTVGMIGKTSGKDEIAERSVQMAVLGMAVGVQLGLDGPTTLEIGMAGLLQDVGLYVMDPRFVAAPESMNESERWEYQKHPTISNQCICGVMEVSHSVQLAVQHVHEQYDGSGFPRGVKGQRIHLFARILNVVESYLRLTSPAANRRPIVPHDALGFMLHQAGRGVFDPQVMKAFLNTETLFPLGSLVELASGDVAQVIRRPTQGFSQPVLQASDGTRIEVETNEIEIVRPVCDPNRDQMRLTQKMMEQAHWNPACNSLHF